MYVALPYSWSGVATRLAVEPPGSVLRIPKYLLDHPDVAGARRSIGMPQGQLADYRLTLPNCRGLHVRDFGTHYEAHVDEVDPACDAIEHLRQDAPDTYIVGAAALGALLALLLSGHRNAMLVGAGLGALLGVLMVPSTHDPARVPHLGQW